MLNRILCKISNDMEHIEIALTDTEPTLIWFCCVLLFRLSFENYMFFRFHKLLKNIIINEEAQIHCVKIVYEFWSTHPQVCDERTFF